MEIVDNGIYSCDLFFNIEKKVTDELFSKSVTKSYPMDSVLIKKRSVPECLFIILKGRAGIYNGDVLVAELGELSITGENILADATATATTIANTDNGK